MEEQNTTDARHDGESTPRSESIPNYDGCCESKEAEEPHNTATSSNSEYFSPQPRRHIGSQWTTGVEATPAASPSASQESLLPIPEGQQVLVQQASEAQDPHDTGLTHLTIRPGLHQSFSEMSTSSNATVKPHPDGQHLPDYTHFPIHPVDASTSHAQINAQGHHGQHPHYPQQAYIALQSQQHPTPYSYQRTRSSHPSHYSSGGRSSHEFDVATAASGSKTVGNSPANSPSLYLARTPRLAPSDSPEPHAHGFSSPSLHWTQNHVPKETQKAEISRSGDSKVVNQYQILGELGRGAHGKVKRAIHMETQKIVAIKIVERKTKKKTLGKDPSHEDKIKREVAILKKARHPHIVGLIEVIDDPQAAKVYIVLEHVELGEVKWATDAYDEVGLLEYRRFLRQKYGVAEDEAAIEEDKRLFERAKKKRLRRERVEARQHARWTDVPSSSFSLEHGGASEEEDEDSDSEFDDESVTSYATDNGTVPLFAHEMGGGDPHMTTAILVRDRTQTSPPAEDPNGQMHAIRESEEEEYEPPQEPTPVAKLTHTGLEGTMYGAYENDLSRAPSAASVHCSVKLPRRFEKVWRPFRQVPLMTIGDTRNVFRDTLLGLEYLHYQGVIHRDIKPANLLQAGDHHVKISDFGVSYLGASLDKTATKEDLDDDTELAKTVGTMEFYAPELCNPDIKKQAKVDGQIDVWALGVTLHCLIYGRLPFDSEEPYAVMTQIWEDELYLPRHRLKAVEEPAGSRPTSRHQPYFQSLPADKRKPEDIVYEPISDELYDLLRRLLIKDPTKRIKLIEIKHHPWLLDGIPNPDEWIRETDPARQAQGRKIEISKEDVADAVVPLGLFDRVLKGIRRIWPRARAQSTVTNEDPTSAASSISSLSRNSRRPSVKPDDLREALKASRDPNTEHPLAQSLTASPEIRNIQEHDFFDESFRAASPANSHDGRASISAAGVSRPHVHRAMTTTTSSSGSQRTIRASALPNRGGIASALLPSTPLAVDTHAEPILGLASAVAVGQIEHPLGASVETSPVSDEPYYPKGSSEEEQGISASTSQQSLPEEARFVGATEPEPLIHHAPLQVVRDYTSADDYEGYEGSDDEDSDDSDEGLSFGRKKK